MSYHLVPPRARRTAEATAFVAPLPPPRRESPQDAADGAPIDLGKLLLALRRRWWLVALVVAGAGGVAGYWVRSQPQLYSATAVVQLVNNRRELAGDLAGDRADDGPAMSLLSQIEILQSRAVAAEAVDSLPLGLRVQASGFPTSFLSDVAVTDSATRANVPITFTDAGVIAGDAERSQPVIPYGAPIYFDNLRFTIDRQPEDVTNGTVVVSTRERAIDAALIRLNAAPKRQTTLIDVRYISDDPVTARHAVNAFVRAYQAVDARLARQQMQRRRQFIEEQLRDTDAQLALAERAMSGFRTRQQAYSAAEKFSAQRDELAQLDMQRQNLDAEQRLATRLLAQLEDPDAQIRLRALRMLASSSAGATPLVGRLYEQLVDYEGSLAEMTSGPAGKASTHPEALGLVTLIASTRQQIVGALEAHVALLDAQLASVEELRGRNQLLMLGVPAAEVEETRLSQNADVLRGQATMLRGQYQQVRIAEAAAVGQVEIVDLAARARPLDVDGVRVVAFALLLGLLAGAGLALLIEALDRSVKGREVIESRLRLPLLATIPRIEAPAAGNRLRNALKRRGGADGRSSVALTAATQVRAPSSESFRQLRTNLLFAGGRSEGQLRTIMVTSAGEGEGKTSVAVNLAITFAQQRFSVLLVDADLLASRVHRVFKLPLGPGVQQVVLEGIHPGAAMTPTSVSGLFVLTAGPSPATDGDAIGSPRLRAMLSDAAQDFDVVILDSAPVLAVSDSVVLSGSVDAVLLVLRAGATRLADAEEALRHLDAVGANVTGAVLNDPDDRVRQYGGRYYGYGYGKRAMAGT